MVIKDENDSRTITELINSLVNEFNNKQTYYEDNLQHFITIILNLLSRNVTTVPERIASNKNEDPLINKMLVHIRQHIDCKEKLKTDYLASLFSLSENYVGEYFKKLTGESLQRYITLYKMKLVEQRLIFSDLTMSEIAYEFGFRDGSHFTRQFKKYNGNSPLYFRKHKKASKDI
jgi:YesN/AraC family two-component response regulator